MSHDEEYFRDIVIGLLCHTSQAEELFDGKISRAFDRNPRREARMFGVLETVEDQIALDIDFAKINRVAAKIAVGLEAAIGQRQYPMNTQFRVVFAEVERSSDAGSRFSPDFSYTKLYPEGWEFTFFDSVQFVVLPN